MALGCADSTLCVLKADTFLLKVGPLKSVVLSDIYVFISCATDSLQCNGLTLHFSSPGGLS